jgi:pilus assembly protein CpaB
VTFLVLPEQARVLAELEQEAKLHLSLVYRGTQETAAEFIVAQDALIEELNAEPEENPESEVADSANTPAESEVTPDNEL